MLYLAAALIFATGVAHSWLGERYLLVRLFRSGGLPKLLGGTAFTAGTLRFVWHLTTVTWWGIAYLVTLVAVDRSSLDASGVLRALAVVALVSGLLPLYFTRGRHLSWIVFFVIAALLWVGGGAIG